MSNRNTSRNDGRLHSSRRRSRSRSQPREGRRGRDRHEPPRDHYRSSNDRGSSFRDDEKWPIEKVGGVWRRSDSNSVIPATPLGQSVTFKMYPRDNDTSHVIHVSAPSDVLTKEFGEAVQQFIKSELVRTDPKTVQANALLAQLQEANAPVINRLDTMVATVKDALDRSSKGHLKSGGSAIAPRASRKAPPLLGLELRT